MKIVNVIGGLGNQMFQYAFALALKTKNPKEEILVDTQHFKSIFFKKFRGANLHNGYEIPKVFPNTNLPVANCRQIKKVSYWIPNYILSRIARKLFPKRNTEYIPIRKNNHSYDSNALNILGDCYYEGYWQSISYYKGIKGIIQDAFSHPEPNEYNKNQIKRIVNCNSVGIHIRRGDYLKEPDFRGICDVEYYQKALEDIISHKDNCVFFIFSNDIDWCKSNIMPLVRDNEIVFVTENKGKDSCWDMFLMSYCKNLIIANSSFSWWGAFLNKNVDRVYAPFPWLNRDTTFDLYDEDWIKISPNSLNNNCRP